MKELQRTLPVPDSIRTGDTLLMCKRAQHAIRGRDMIFERDLDAMLTPLTLYLTRAPFTNEQPCAVCGAKFVPAEDSGSRLLSLMPADQEQLSVLMCGGCHSKWSHGVTVTARWGSESPVVPVLRHPGGG
jgi:hypothetical protein